MEKLHNASNSKLSKAIFMLISITFFVSGMAGYVATRSDTSAVKVNGESIDQSLLQQRYSDEIQRLTIEKGAQFAIESDNPEFTATLRKQVLDRLIDQELLRQYVKELHLGLSDEQIKQYIVTTPMFQSNGKFDNNLYQQLLSNNRMTPDTYAEYTREALTLAQLQSGWADTAFLTPEQVGFLSNALFQKREFRVAHLVLSDELMAQQAVSEQEITDYYNAHKASFVQPEQVKVQYIDLDKNLAANAVQVTDQDVEKYYQDNQAQFSTKGQEKVAHIQFNDEKSAQAAYQALQNGADFADLAKKESTDKLSAVNGGDLGWLNQGDLPEAFENAAKALTAGQYTEPVKVDNQYHIIKVLDRKEGNVQPLAAVKERIVDLIRQDAVSNKFYALEKIVGEKAFEDQSSLQTAADAVGAKLQQTDYFSRKAIPDALNFSSVINAMFDGDVSQDGQNSDPMNVGELHSIAIRVLEHKPQVTLTLEQSKAQIEQHLKQQKAESVLLTQAQQMVQELNAGKQVVNLKFDVAQTWSSAENKNPTLFNTIAAMKLNGDKSTYQATIDQGNVLIIALDKIVDAELTDSLRSTVNKSLLNLDMNDLQANLLKSLRSKAKIEYNEEYLRQSQE